MNFKNKKKDFDSLTESGQWLWLIKNKDLVELTLDNDNTTFTFNNEDKSEDCTLVSFKCYIGNRAGSLLLLRHLGVRVQFA